jgi:hypothetical protein
VEHKWVHNFLSIAKYNPDIKRIITSRQIDNYFMDSLMETYPEIDNNHTYSTLRWTIEMAKVVIRTNSEIEADNSGSEYRLSWNE